MLYAFILLILDIFVRKFRQNLKDILKDATQSIGKDTRIVSPKPIITYSIHSIMEDDKSSSFQNILLDSIDMPINISLLSTPKALSSNSDLTGIVIIIISTFKS